MVEKTDEETKVLHDEDNGKFYIPFPDKQAVLRYTLEEEIIEFRSIFVPPSLRNDGLATKIISRAYDYAEKQQLSPQPESMEEFVSQNQQYV